MLGNAMPYNLYPHDLFYAVADPEIEPRGFKVVRTYKLHSIKGKEKKTQSNKTQSYKESDLQRPSYAKP